MCELIESLVYYLKSKGKRLPFFIVLILIALAFWFYTLNPADKVQERLEHPAVTSIIEAPVPEKKAPQVQAEKPKPIPSQRPVREAEKAKVEEKPSPYEQDLIDQPDSSYGLFVTTMERNLKAEGINPELAKKITIQIRSDLGHYTGPGPMDLIQEIRKVLGEDASAEDVARIQEILMNSLATSNREFSARNNLDPNEP